MAATTGDDLVRDSVRSDAEENRVLDGDSEQEMFYANGRVAQARASSWAVTMTRRADSSNRSKMSRPGHPRDGMDQVRELGVRV